MIADLLIEIQGNMFNQALQFREENTFEVSEWEEFKSKINEGGFVKCGWDGTVETENLIKDKTKATVRCIPFDENPEGLNCIYSEKPAKHEAIFSRAY